MGPKWGTIKSRAAGVVQVPRRGIMFICLLCALSRLIHLLDGVWELGRVRRRQHNGLRPVQSQLHRSGGSHGGVGTQEVAALFPESLDRVQVLRRVHPGGAEGSLGLLEQWPLHRELAWWRRHPQPAAEEVDTGGFLRGGL